MSSRTLIELNHDYCPNDGALEGWAESIRSYMSSGNREFLPKGVEWIELRHHSDRGIIEALRAALQEAQKCNRCGGPETSDKDCICGGSGRRSDQVLGLNGCIEWWHEKHKQASAALAKERETSRELRAELENLRTIQSRCFVCDLMPDKCECERLIATAAPQPPVEQTEREWRVMCTDRFGADIQDLRAAPMTAEQTADYMVQMLSGTRKQFSDDQGKTWIDAPQEEA